MKNFNHECTVFTEQLSMIIEAGIPLADGIRAIGEEVDDKEYQKVLFRISDDMNDHKSLSEALKNAGVFDQYMVSMVEVGEKSGYLDNVMKQLSLYYHRIDSTREKLKDAITYPMVLVVMMLVVIAMLCIKILPLFRTVLRNMGTDLSAFASGAMNMGSILAIVALVILGVLFVAVVFLIWKSDNGIIGILDKFTLTRELAQKIAVSQFAFAMSLLLNSGYDTSQSLEMIPDMIGDEEIKKKVVGVKEKVDAGTSFSEALIGSKIFSGIYNRMLSIGFKAGKADETMAKISQEYENEVDTSIDRFLDIIEPTLVALLSLVVGIILLSVMLPLMSIMSTL
ncbi:MAG: type II secretion system F family protein [Erysipelotrichaceae bacterium]|nr:type II secretion system F family protein [Erysipelotrichaceae bacterium]